MDRWGMEGKLHLLEPAPDCGYVAGGWFGRGGAFGEHVCRIAGAQRADSRDLVRPGTVELCGHIRQRVGRGALVKNERERSLECVAATRCLEQFHRPGIS